MAEFWDFVEGFETDLISILLYSGSSSKDEYKDNLKIREFNVKLALNCSDEIPSISYNIL